MERISTEREREGIEVDEERVMCWTGGFWDDMWRMTKIVMVFVEA